MLYNFVTKEAIFIVIISPKDDQFFSALKYDLVVHEYTDGYKLEKPVTWWLVTDGTDFYQPGTQKLVAR
jgi:hypothetical protein